MFTSKCLGGDPDIYTRILALIDCAALQQEFNRDMEGYRSRMHGSPTAKPLVRYMFATANRLVALGCKGKF